ncbi:hypothetical protein M3B51_13285 [Kocuria carniphila]|nr:hypothetical protein [Kocuria carniphila]MCT1803750.1 hypothetical protein [Kocuria carniphila]
MPEETVALAQLSGLRFCLARLLAALDPRLTNPLIEGPDMNAEVLRDLRERHVRITILNNVDHVVAELLGERLGHDDILPSQPLD